MESLTTRFKKEVFLPYLELLKAQYRFHPQFADAKRIWESKLTQEEIVNGPYLEKSQIYAKGELLEDFSLHQKTINTIRKKLGDRSALYKHQTDALKLLLNGKHAIITTGTSSGKTLCYQIPILDDLIRDDRQGLRAIIIYPLNALVNDQLNEWEEILKDHPGIKFARFTGQTPNSQKEYEERMKEIIREQQLDQGYTQQERERKVAQLMREKLQTDPTNRLNHRDAIRSTPPHILITNFSMLEYLLERPVDSPIFQNSRLRFLVLDEVHAYRGVQSTEIAFLIRRLKDRLQVNKFTCAATSATLGKQEDPENMLKVRKFASDLFGEKFEEPNPIYGTIAQLELASPSISLSPNQYVQALEGLGKNSSADIANYLYPQATGKTLADKLNHDENLYRLRTKILRIPTLLSQAAEALWNNNPDAKDGLLALLNIVATYGTEDSHEDLLPTRLHYFIKVESGFHVCLHMECPGRQNRIPAFFTSRRSDHTVPEGNCPECWNKNNISSKLVELVTCRKCGYLFGALQDLGPRRAQNPETGGNQNCHFDSFSTELGWGADSFWSYFSIEHELPYPPQIQTDEDEDEDDLFSHPAELEWCVCCGKKSDKGAGDNCPCKKPHLRKIKIFHRQCPHFGKSSDRKNLYNESKKLLTRCPNCGARNGSGLEPLRRFQESEDETGLAMAIPLAHFQVTPSTENERLPRKLLCFTDHRQRAAAFPSLLEEETFSHDLGREIVKIVCKETKPIDFESLGKRLAEVADPKLDNFNPNFFLPTSRLPDDEDKSQRDLWIAEVFSYFGIPDSARESAEDLGLIAVEYKLKEDEKTSFHALLQKFGMSLDESVSALQTLLSFIRNRKAFTLPKSVEPDSPAFGRVTSDIYYMFRREGNEQVHGWLPRLTNHGTYQDNVVTNYLRRLINGSPQEVLELANSIWEFLTSKVLLISTKREMCKLDHEKLTVIKPNNRYVCSRCQIVTTYSCRQCCPRKQCQGKLEEQPFNPNSENIIALWVQGNKKAPFTTLKSEEHTAQLKKDLAKRIEDEFRAEGVNLLSSTTTFELGINIGDLQKVLLRNAPPTSTNYVQRVGRAGRGKDKNSICVTLCRRTKYDLDAWKDPPRLMAGEIRPPTVFTKNKVIAQRHFNATMFAQFLRIKIIDEKILNKPEQLIPLEVFLSSESRGGVPQNFRSYPIDQYLNFLDWLKDIKMPEIFKTDECSDLISSVSNFEQAKKETEEKYKQILEDITSELTALIDERKKIFSIGEDTRDIDQTTKNLLGKDAISVLAKREFLPRYAFPLDTVTLETGWSRWSGDTDVELSRDRAIAIAEFAPGAQVIARKKVFTSAGLYVVSKKDTPDRLWYSKCPDCEQIRTTNRQEDLKRACQVCQRPITDQYIKPFVEPVAFSVRIEKKRSAIRYRRSTLIRQRQPLTHFIDHMSEEDFCERGLFRVALKESGRLFRYNLGPANKGFILCRNCGYSEPLNGNESKTEKHKRLRKFAGTMDCKETPWKYPLAYGHQFSSFCLIARPIQSPQSIASIAFALQKGLCKELEIEPSDIGVAWRWLSKRSESSAANEVILYDRTPGGSGFVKEGFELWEEVVARASNICEQCTCEQACYDCLKSYGNQTYHEELNRHTVVDFLAPQLSGNSVQ